jgi:hypothetical protein
MGQRPPPFWPGVPPETVDRIVRTLGRSTRDWRLETAIAEEMASLESTITEHRHEWRSMILMARTLDLRRRAAFALEEVDYFHANTRPVEPEWERRLADQTTVRRDISALRDAVRTHFARRYCGDAFEEWVHDLFGLYESRLDAAAGDCRDKLRRAADIYARPH